MTMTFHVHQELEVHLPKAVVLCLHGRALSPILNSEERYLFQFQIFHLNFVQ